MLGSAVSSILKEHELITPARHELNIGNFSQVMRFKADFIIHLASETDHEYCDENPSQAYFINTVGTGNMMRLARSLDIPILYISTASVFDGIKQNPYYPDDKPNPINHYNTSKWYGELLVKAYPKHYILRTGWLFGGGPSVDKKFVNKIMNKIKAGQKTIKVANDCIGSPTYSEDLAIVIKRCVEDKAVSGTSNCVNADGGVSRFEVAVEMVKILNSDVTILPVPIDDLKEEFPCKRTNYEALENNYSMRSWKDALKEYLDAYYRN
jgi:dTDP-4-dehydrorhamnose reductase